MGVGRMGRGGKSRKGKEGERKIFIDQGTPVGAIFSSCL
jgi:hypothetical protein